MTRPEPMANWLLRKLMVDGVIGPGGITRKAKPRRCKCRALILAGLDHPTTCAIERRVDPDPLTPLGEALALVEGRYTISLNHEAGAYVLNQRYALQIQTWPAGTRASEDILRQHRCSTPPIVGPLLAPSNFSASRPKTSASSTPPF